MRKLNKRINDVGRVIADSLALILLFGILALPASSVSLLHVAPAQNTSVDVLSTQDVREIPRVPVEIKESSMPGMLDAGEQIHK